MKIYIVWAYDTYYPSGPDDIQGIFISFDAAHELHQQLVAKTGWDHIHITTEEVQ